MAITTLIFDFSRVLIFPKNSSYKGNLNDLYTDTVGEPNFQLRDHFVINHDLIQFLNTLPSSIRLLIFTSGTILHQLPEINSQLIPPFQEIITSKDLGYKKSDQRAYEELARRLDLLPHQTIFVDDSVDNVKAALHAGLQASHFHTTVKLLEFLSQELT